MVRGAPAFEAVGDVFDGAGVGVAGGAYLDGGGTGDHEFDGVLGADDAAHADDGEALRRSGGLVDHADGDGLDRRAGEAAGDVGDAWTAGLDVDGQGEEGVDEGDGVGTAIFHDSRHEGDAGDVGRELDHERTPRGSLTTRDELVE